MRFLIAALLFAAPLALAQRNSGELRVTVLDPSGAALSATVTIKGDATQVRRECSTDTDGRCTVKELPFGIYRLEIRRDSFNPYTSAVEIRSPLPLDLRVSMTVAGIGTQVEVTDSVTLIDPQRSGGVQYIGGDTLRTHPASIPGRSIIDLVNSQPGWLLEANGVLHPRGAEYDTQYVVDGVPITDNRSPAFAPEIDADDVQSMSVLTGNYPAEYGRKLGGVVEVTTMRDSRPGLHLKGGVSGGSFATAAGSLSGLYTAGRTTVTLSADAAETDRYLDPPTTANFTNHGSSSGETARFERDFSDRDRLRLSATRHETRFQVPNELLQEQAGQRQDCASEETAGQASYQHIFSPQVLTNVRAMVRDLSAGLWSNPFATPISASQQRGFRETYVNGSVSAHIGRHELKAGAEFNFANLNENFAYTITAYQIGGVPIFDPDTPPAFQYAGKGRDREQSAFVQDVFHAGRLTVSAGLRFDHYSLLVNEKALSPRLGVAWHVPSAGLVFRASYDRAFQTPAIENLLLSSSEAVRTLNDHAIFLPVRPSRGNFVEAGFTKSLHGKLRLDAQFFNRSLDNFGDDDLLLNTGVTFPINFSHADIHGLETKLELPRWGPVSGYVSYSNLSGKATLPVTGGLFLSDNVSDLLNSKQKLPITQDQRNTAGARLRTEIGTRAWVAIAAAYGSGLPVTIDSVDLTMLREQYGQAVLDRVNFDRGRMRPSFTLDASTGMRLWTGEKIKARIQGDVFNITDRLNAINFAGLFSGTAIARPRSASARFQIEF